MKREERNRLNYLRAKDRCCVLDKEELWELIDLENKESEEQQ